MRRLAGVVTIVGLFVLLPATATAAPATKAAPARHLRDIVLRPNVSRNHTTSTNWSGYAVEGGSAKFTDVRGSWVQPAVKCSPATNYSSFWVGIDGYNSNSVEQLGTDSDCSNGRSVYYAWWEMFPLASVPLPPGKYPVKPGDVLTAEVSVTGPHHDVFTLSIKSSRGWSFQKVKTASVAVARESAEWITEAPFVDGAVANLSDFNKVIWTHCRASTGGPDKAISAFTAHNGPHSITMYDSIAPHDLRALPSALSSTGAGFSISWRHP